MARRSGVFGAQRLSRFLRELPKETTAEVREAVQAGAGILLREMLRRVPRDTGTLAGELRIQPGRDRLSAKVGVIGRRSMRKAWYAIFVEYGTAQRPAQPFMWPAAELTATKIVPLIDAAVDRALERAGTRAAAEGA